MSTQAAVRVRCPHCNKLLSVSAALRGRRITCPNPACGKQVAVVTEPPPLPAKTAVGLQPRPHWRRRPIIVGVVGGACLLGVCALVWSAVFHRDESPDRASALDVASSTSSTLVAAGNGPHTSADQDPAPDASTPSADDGSQKGNSDKQRPSPQRRRVNRPARGKLKKSPDQPLAPNAASSTPVVAGIATTRRDQPLAPGATAKPSSDLDEILHMLSLGVFVEDKRLARPNEADWAKKIERLRSSRDPAVAAAAAANSPAAIRHALVREIEDKLAADIKAIDEKSVAKDKAIGATRPFFGVLGGRSDQEIDDAERRHDISSADAVALKEENSRQSAKDWNAAMAAGQSLSVENKANQQLASLRPGIEVLDADVVADKLVSALRVRGGPKVTQAPLQVKSGWSPVHAAPATADAFSTRSAQIGSNSSLVSAVSRSEHELTRLTLLITVDTQYGSRFICAYVPRLGASERFRIEPVLMSRYCLHRPAELTPDDPIPGKIGTKLRYSIWCDQFQIEDIELAMSDPVEEILAYGGIQPESAYLTAPMTGFGAPKTIPQRLGLTFTKLTRAADAYDVEAQITRFDQRDQTKVQSSEKYTGTVRRSPTKNLTLLFKLSAPAGEDLALEFLVDQVGGISGVPGGLVWNTRELPRGHLMYGQVLSPAKQLEDAARQREIWLNLDAQIVKARKLARMGHRDEAEKLLKEILASCPGDQQMEEERARRSLRELDELVNVGRRMGVRSPSEKPSNDGASPSPGSRRMGISPPGEKP